MTLLRIGDEIINLDNVICIDFCNKDIRVHFAVTGRSGPDPTEPFPFDESPAASRQRSPIPQPRAEWSEWRDYFPYLRVFGGDNAIALRKWLMKNVPSV